MQSSATFQDLITLHLHIMELSNYGSRWSNEIFLQGFLWLLVSFILLKIIMFTLDCFAGITPWCLIDLMKRRLLVPLGPVQ